MIGGGHLRESHLLLPACFKRSLPLDDDLGSAYSLMARSLMPGDDYLTTISRFHNFLKPESYVEVGVLTGNSLGLVNSQTKATGIDPKPSEGIESHFTDLKPPLLP